MSLKPPGRVSVDIIVRAKTDDKLKDDELVQQQVGIELFKNVRLQSHAASMFYALNQGKLVPTKMTQPTVLRAYRSRRHGGSLLKTCGQRR